MRDQPVVLPAVAQPVAIVAPQTRSRVPAILGGVVALALLGGGAAWFARGDATAATIGNVDTDATETLTIANAIATHERVPPAPVSKTLVEQYPMPDRGGVPLDETFASLQSWVHPVVGSAELMPPLRSRHFGSHRAGIERAECGDGHCGIDLDGPRGRPLVAVADGTVIRVERKELGSDGRSGRYVRIQHDDGAITAYMHMDDVADVQTGDRVTAGQYIGTLGATAVFSAPPHCHFSLELPEQPGTRGDGIQTTYVDPAPFLVRATIAAKPERKHAVKPAF